MHRGKLAPLRTLLLWLHLPVAHKRYNYGQSPILRPLYTSIYLRHDSQKHTRVLTMPKLDSLLTYAKRLWVFRLNQKCIK